MEEKYIMKCLIKVFASVALIAASSASYAGDWPSDVKEAVDVKQAAFCNLVESYQGKAEAAKQSQNQIKMMAVSQEQSDDLKALIRNKKFDNWVAQVASVDLYPSEEAGSVDQYHVKLTAYLDCGVMIHSSMEKSAKKIGDKSTPILFKQLAKVSRGEFVLISGEFSNDFKASKFCVGSSNCSKLKGAKSIQTTFATTYDSLVTFK
jgi:hypothetical protein